MMEDRPFPAALPRDWAQGLAEELKGLDVVFLTLDAVHRGASHLSQEEQERLGIEGDQAPEITHQYTRALSRVIEALGHLPEFTDGAGLAALSALRLDILSLDEGSNPARLKPREGISVGADNAGRRIAKANLVLCVRLLEEMGVSQTKARKMVASIFARAGHKGRQGGPLSAATVYNWREEIMSFPSPDVRGRRMIDGELDKWKSDPAWPPKESDAIAFIERRAANPIFSLAHTT